MKQPSLLNATSASAPLRRDKAADLVSTLSILASWLKRGQKKTRDRLSGKTSRDQRYPRLRSTLCHVDRSGDISKYFWTEIARNSSAPLGMTMSDYEYKYSS